MAAANTKCIQNIQIIKKIINHSILTNKMILYIKIKMEILYNILPENRINIYLYRAYFYAYFMELYFINKQSNINICVHISEIV